jgi:two-component system, repressor protein LuxO
MSTVLIVEDNAQLSSFYNRIVEHVGVRGVTVHSCREALDFLQQELPQLILLDITLLDGNAQVVIDYVRQQPHHEHTHIAVVTGDCQSKKWAAALQVDTFLVKPVTSSALMALVEQFTQQVIAA